MLVVRMAVFWAVSNGVIVAAIYAEAVVVRRRQRKLRMAARARLRLVDSAAAPVYPLRIAGGSRG